MADNTIERAVEALKAADAAGDVDSARTLAAFLRDHQAEEAAPSGDRGFVPFANRRMAEIVGAPTDLVNLAIRQIPGAEKHLVPMGETFGGSKSIERGLSAIGSKLPPEGAQPETFPENMGEGFAEGMGFLVPGMGAAKMAGRFGAPIVSAAVRRPVTTAVTEAAAGTGAGAGRKVAAEEYPGNSTAQFLAEFGGGVVAGTAPGIFGAVSKVIGPRAWWRATKKGAEMVKGAIAPFTESGSRYRASQRLQELTANAQAAAAELGKESIGGLSPATQTGEKRLMALEQAIRDADPEMDARFLEQANAAAEKLRNEIQAIAPGSIEDTRGFIEGRVSNLKEAMDRRMEFAAQRAQGRLDALQPAERKAAESVIVRDEIEKALAAARKAEGELWEAVPKQTPVKPENSLQAYRELVASLPRAQLDDVPDIARKFLDRESNQFLGNVTTVNEAWGLRSKLLEASRNARAAGSYNTARIADDLADALLEDLGASTFSRRRTRAGELIDESGFDNLVDQLRTRPTAAKAKAAAGDTLMQWIVRNGGLREYSGELQNLGISNKTRPGFIRGSGMNLNDATRAAWEKGFFPEFGGKRPEPQALLDAIRAEFMDPKKARRINVDDAAKADTEFLEMMDAEFNRLDIDVDTLTNAQVRQRLEEAERRAIAESGPDVGEGRPVSEAEIYGEAVGSKEKPSAVPQPRTMTEAGAKLREALDYSRNLKERFHQGVVGRILGHERTGGSSVAPELTLDVSVGRGGTRGAVAADDVLAAGPGGAAATERYVTRQFVDAATDKAGKINPAKAQKWIRDNQDLLDRFPDIGAKMRDAESAQALADRTITTMEGRIKRLDNPKVSYAADFLKADPGKEIQRIFRSPNPARASAEIRRQISKDRTGKAAAGFKSALSDYLIRQSETSAVNEAGERSISGRRIMALLRDPKMRAVYGQHFSEQEMYRFEQIGKELAKLETAAGKLPSVQGAIQDLPNSLLHMVGRVSGAQLGRRVAMVTGGGTVQTPGIFSGRAAWFVSRLTVDRAQQLLSDAVQDRDLFRALLLPISKPKSADAIARGKDINRRLNSWLAGPGSRLLEGEDEEPAPPLM